MIINLSQVTHWFNAFRNLPEDERYRALEGVWDTQLQSKAWIIQELNNIVNINNINIYVFGGWIGILSSLLFQNSKFTINKIRSIDIDPWCEPLADTVCKPYEMDGWRFKAITSDMATYQYEDNITPDIVINTSTEHVSQSIYQQWYDNIPSNTLVVIQGNNFYSCPEHVRCAESLDQFKMINYVDNTLYEGVLSNPMYDRYMCIWRKNDIFRK
jgi:hypothetical protein